MWIPAARTRRSNVTARRHFSWKTTRAGNRALRPPRRVVRPGDRQIQRGAQQPGAHAGPERDGDGDLAIGHLAQRAAVLPRHPDRVRALFGETGLVEDQHAAPFGHHGPQAPPHRLGVPGRVGDEVLEGLIGRRLGHPGQHRLHRLATAVAEEPVDVLPQRHQLRAMAKADLELIQPPGQSSQQRPRRVVEHSPRA